MDKDYLEKLERIRIATRQSRLAVWQAKDVARRLRTLHPGLRCDLVKLTTRADRFVDRPLAAIGGKALFVKELEQAMLEGRADIAVHSMKDVPLEFPEGLHLPVVIERANPLDGVVSPSGHCLASLPKGARVGSSSLRRQCQVRSVRPDLEVGPIRGNVDTRLEKLDGGEFDALILACSGLERLGLTDRISEALPVEVMVPAIGQGAMGIECRQGDTPVELAISNLNHVPSWRAVRAERAMNLSINGNCHAPIGAYATLHGRELRLDGLVGSIDGRTILRESAAGDAGDPESLGAEVAARLRAAGASTLLAGADV